MNWLRELTRRLKMLWHRRQFDVELKEEMQLHLELLQEQQRQSGKSAAEARHAARRQFGNETALRESSYFALGWEWFDSFIQDVHYGIRAMLRSPGITLVALLSLALGIGANTAIFSLMDAVMLKSLPVHDPSRLVLFGDGQDCCISDMFPNPWLFSYPFYREMQKQNRVFSDVAAAFSKTDDVHGFIEGRSQAEPMHIEMVSGTYFPMLGVRAAVGRVIAEEDDLSEGRNAVAVVSYAWWTGTLGRDPEVLRKKLRIGPTIFSIIGVAPPQFFGTTVGEAPDMWVPLSMQKEIPPGWDGYNREMFESLNLMARLKPGVSITEANANADVLFHQILRGFPSAPLTGEDLRALEKTHVSLTPMATGLSRLRYQFSKPLKVLMGIVGLVLLIACANIANLLLARSIARARELAVRQALGAGRTRLIRQLLTESAVLALTGGALGVAFAFVASHFLLRVVSDGSDTFRLEADMSVRLLLFTLGVTLATALLFGSIPAARATRLNLTDALKDGRGQTDASAKGPLTKALVLSQVTLSLVLLVGAGVFVRSLVNLANVETGFDKNNVLRMRLDTSSVGYVLDERLLQLYRQIEDRVKAVPGVRAASFCGFTFHEGTWNNTVWVQGYAHQDVDVHHNVVGNGYFAAMGIPLLSGRNFGPQDTCTSPKVAIISQTMARNLFPTGSPIGKHYGHRGPESAADIEVIGVAKDVKFNSLDELPEPGDYYPYLQSPRYLNDFVVRYVGSPASLISAVRGAIHDVDPNLPVSNVITLDKAVSQSISNQRLVAQLSAFFGFLALFLSCIGIYGLMSYTVVRRTNEIGLRMALGANRSSVLWMILRESLWLVAIGVAIGVPVALLAERLVGSMLFGLPPHDPLSLFAGTAILLAVAVLAGYLPARRASLVDPMVSLRYE